MSTKQLTIAELHELVIALTARVDELSKPRNESQREMTNDDALRIMNGDLKDKKHKDAAEALGLSYGQIYSCRLGFTFKAVHKQLAEQGYKNPWMK
jgi:hypothetical protein